MNRTLFGNRERLINNKAHHTVGQTSSPGSSSWINPQDITFKDRLEKTLSHW